jgi:hypothetical protein
MDITLINEVAKLVEQFGAIPLLVYVIMRQRLIWQHVSNHIPTEIKELKKTVEDVCRKVDQ